jgi:hypothetical protein
MQKVASSLAAGAQKHKQIGVWLYRRGPCLEQKLASKRHLVYVPR